MGQEHQKAEAQDLEKAVTRANQKVEGLALELLLAQPLE
jgi:hypothetical protein